MSNAGELLRLAAEEMRLNASFGTTPDAFHLAVADWLTIVAHDVSRPDFDKGYLRVYDQAYEVARAYLGESE